jgi:hypothetical protein
MAHDQIEHGTESRVVGKVDQAENCFRDTVSGHDRRWHRDESTVL